MRNERMNGKWWGSLAATIVLALASSCFAADDVPGGKSQAKAGLSAEKDDLPLSKDDLFGDTPASPAKSDVAAPASSGVRGFLQTELARNTVTPVHWSKMLTRLDIGTQGNWGQGIKWKLGARADYDAVYDLYHDYSAEVAKDQRTNAMVRETYVDMESGDWDFRLGRQHVVWGEMVGLFFADVVSARDMREFILPEFEVMRIPQWAARAEYFKNDLHAELLWIPVPSYDEIGRPGAQFYPYARMPPAGYAVTYRDEVRPTRTTAHSNAGLRLSALSHGWDVSAFVYHSYDTAPTFYREIDTLPVPTFIYEARHDRIHQAGGTIAKDLGWAVLKAEGVYTRGRKFNVQRPDVVDGLVPQNTADWAIGLDLTPFADTRINVQYFQRVFYQHDPGILFRERENGYSVLLNQKLGGKVEAQVTWIASVNRTDWLLRPRLAWTIDGHWRLLGGYDRFRGQPTGVFGRYDQCDRGYFEARYSF